MRFPDSFPRTALIVIAVSSVLGVGVLLEMASARHRIQEQTLRDVQRLRSELQAHQACEGQRARRELEQFQLQAPDQLAAMRQFQDEMAELDREVQTALSQSRKNTAEFDQWLGEKAAEARRQHDEEVQQQLKWADDGQRLLNQQHASEQQKGWD
jgi:hypothetical protein